MTRRTRRSLIFLGTLVAAYFVVGFYFWSTQDQAIFKPLRAVAATPADLDPPLPYEDVEIPADQSSIHGFWLPASDDAPVALYLHGQDSTIGKNLEHPRCLNQLGCSVFVVDYRGFGETYGTMTPTESSVYEDAETAWDYLTTTRGLAPECILIYGHSLGGAIAIELATRHPDAGGLVAESTFTSIKDMARWKFAVTHLFPIDWLLRHRFDSIEKVRSRRIPPALFVHGLSDAKVPCFMCEDLHDAASVPNKELLLIENGGHANRGPGQATYQAKMAAFLDRCFQLTPSDLIE